MTITSTIDPSQIKSGWVYPSGLPRQFTALQGETIGVGKTASEAINNCMSAFLQPRGSAAWGYASNYSSIEPEIAVKHITWKWKKTKKK